MTVWFAFEVYDNREWRPDDIIAVSDSHSTLFELLRKRADQTKKYITTSPNPLFTHEYRYRDNDKHHSYIGIKELPVFSGDQNDAPHVQAG